MKTLEEEIKDLWLGIAECQADMQDPLDTVEYLRGLINDYMKRIDEKKIAIIERDKVKDGKKSCSKER